MANIPQPTKKRFYKRWWFWALVVITALVAVGIVGGGSAYSKAQKQMYSYLEETVQVQSRKLSRTISTNGKLAADNSTQLYLTAPDTVTEVNVQVGDEVNKDELLIKTDRGQEIESPFDGRVLSVNTFVGDKGTVTAPVVEVGFRSNHVEFIASEAEVLDVRVGQHATLTVPSHQDGEIEYDAIVQEIDVQKESINSGVSAAGGSTTESGYLIKVSADNLPEEVRGYIGLSVDVVVDIYETDNVASIEPSAIQYDDDNNPFVYLPVTVDDAFIQKAAGVEDITDLLQTKDIETGFEGDDYIEVTSGLKSGEKVMLYIPNGDTGSGSLF